MKKTKELAVEILGEFEEFLADKGIKIPNKDREGNDEEACLFGDDYYHLEEMITSRVEQVIGNLKVMEKKTHSGGCLRVITKVDGTLYSGVLLKAVSSLVQLFGDDEK